MVGLAGEVEAVAAVRPDLAGHPDRGAAVDEVAALLDVQLDEHPDAARAAPDPPPSTTSSKRHAVAVPQHARLLPGDRPGRQPRAQAGQPEPRPLLLDEHRDPDRPGGHDPARPQLVDRGQRRDHAQRPVVRPAVEHRVEVRAGQDAAGAGAGAPTTRRGCRCRRTRARRPRGDGLLAEPVGELALGLGERLAEVAARGRRPPDRRQVGPHPLEVVGHAPSNAATGRGATSAPVARSRIRDPHTADMEFQEVVRRRRMVRDYSDEPVDPAVIDLRAGQRGARTERRVQPGLGVPGARHARTTYAASGRPPPTTSTTPTAGWPG